ncbi:MAG: tetratricopeptide repeat protein [Alistipes sp.]|nr:tetratricopeptide repeat protein [Alistipes sp.]
MNRIFTLLTILLLAPALCAAQTDTTEATAPTATSDAPEVLWEVAGAAYNAGDYAKAIDSYTRILNQDLHSADLYYNLAGAYFKQDNLGKAILYYNRALRLKPNDEDIRHNLEYAEQSTKDSINKIPEFFLKSLIRNIRGALSCTAWTVISLIMLIVALTFGLCFTLANRLSLRKMGFYLMALSALLFIGSTLFAWSERNMLINRNEAIIMNSAVSIKSSPDKSATELFVLHEGTKVSIGKSIEGWVEVRIADGRKGWIEQERVERI